MKRFFASLLGCLLLLSLVPTAAADGFHYENETLGFSLTVPGLSDAEIAAEEYGSGVRLFHRPSQAQWGGLLGSIEVITPRSQLFSGGNYPVSCRVLAMGADRVFLWKYPGGGANSGGEQLQPFMDVSGLLSVENLRNYLVPAHPDSQPVLNTSLRLAYLTAENGLLRPDASLTRGELAEMLYALLEADNKDQTYEAPFSDVTGIACAQAVGYLASYGILTGYPDGTFRPNAPISRAAFAVLLHRCQFATPVGRYGDAPDFSDIPAGYWAEDAVYSAGILGWMAGTGDGLFRPSREITRAEAVTAINRLLGRDESHTPVDGQANPFSDLDTNHWAYANLLEAAGALSAGISPPFAPDSDALPAGSRAHHFISEGEGWCVTGSQLWHTADGGATWTKTGTQLPFRVSGLFFFNSREGLALGSGEAGSCLLLQTADGGITWHDFPADPAAQKTHFPAAQFPTEKSMLDAIAAAELRPAGKDVVYLTIRYRPYESIYPSDFEAVKQTAITVEALRPTAE